ncbi:MAG: tetratricopeptide repeat protein [Pseudomonadota bacterium]
MPLCSRFMARVIRVAVAATACGACATTPSTTSTSGQATASDVTAEDAASGRELQLHEVFQHFFSMPAGVEISPALRSPQTLDDVKSVIRSDNFFLYEGADRFFEKYLLDHPNDVEAMAWQAQMHLAWADSALVTEHALGRSIEQLHKQKDNFAQLSQDGSLSADTRSSAATRARETGWLLDATVDARDRLRGLAVGKLHSAQERCALVLELAPTSYLGTRLSADLYRLSEQWPEFERTVAELEKKQPDSAGLHFQKGVDAYKRQHDLALAEKELKASLARDENFVKARYTLALVLLASGRIDEASAAIELVLKQSPGHPLAHSVKKYIAELKQAALPV